LFLHAASLNSKKMTLQHDCCLLCYASQEAGIRNALTWRSFRNHLVQHHNSWPNVY
jgi:hypothetical protein